MGDPLAGQFKVYVGGLYGSSLLSPRSPETLKSKLRDFGFTIVGLNEDPDTYVAYDYDEDDSRRVETLGIPAERRILIINEPKVVWPLNNLNRNLLKFGLTLSLGRPGVFRENGENWPQFWVEDTPKNIEYTRSSRSAIICGNKLSLLPAELYSLRRLAVSRIREIDLYGGGWDYRFTKKIKIMLSTLKITVKARQLPHWRGIRSWFWPILKSNGAPKDKLDLLARYRTTIVIENSREYMTEKLFDAFFARTIPIYVGPELDSYSIPKDLVIIAEPSISSIRAGILESELTDYDKWQRSVQEWLSREDVKANWKQEEVFLRIFNRILVQLLS